MVGCHGGMSSFRCTLLYWSTDVKRCVDGYRESLRMSRARRLELQAQRAENTVPVTSSPKISRVNRVVSKRLLPKARLETREGIWHLSKCAFQCFQQMLIDRKPPQTSCGLANLLGGLLEALAFEEPERYVCIELVRVPS